MAPNERSLILAVFTDSLDAQRAIDQLQQAGFLSCRPDRFCGSQWKHNGGKHTCR
jgi:hypothetical protein